MRKTCISLILVFVILLTSISLIGCDLFNDSDDSSKEEITADNWANIYSLGNNYTISLKIEVEPGTYLRYLILRDKDNYKITMKQFEDSELDFEGNIYIECVSDGTYSYTEDDGTFIKEKIDETPETMEKGILSMLLFSAEMDAFKKFDSFHYDTTTDAYVCDIIAVGDGGAAISNVTIKLNDMNKIVKINMTVVDKGNVESVITYGNAKVSIPTDADVVLGE